MGLKFGSERFWYGYGTSMFGALFMAKKTKGFTSNLK
jgi:hypothetical protein